MARQSTAGAQSCAGAVRSWQQPSDSCTSPHLTFCPLPDPKRHLRYPRHQIPFRHHLHRPPAALCLLNMAGYNPKHFNVLDNALRLMAVVIMKL